jgi:hypothetical protein
MDYTKRVNSIVPILKPYEPGWATYAPLLTPGPCPCGRDESPTVEAAGVALGRLPECSYCGCVPVAAGTIAETLRLVGAVSALPPNPRFFYEGDARVYTLPPAMAAAVSDLPVGFIEGHKGWRAVGPTNGPAWGLARNGVTIARVTGRGLAVTPAAVARAVKVAAKAKASANHDAYNAQLGMVRVALDADPTLRAAVEAIWASCHGATTRLYGPAVEAAGHSQGFPAVPIEEPGRSGALALAYLGWGWAPGQAGGVLLLPGGGQVGVRGALRLPLEGGR